MQVLADLMHLPLEHYHQVIVSWFEMHLKMHQVARAWWSIHHGSWLHQQAAFKYECPVDGLELWAVLVALGMHVTVVLESALWSTRPAGFELQDCMLMCGMDGAVLCKWSKQGDQDTSSEMVGAPLDFPEEELLPSRAMGCPRASEQPRLSLHEAASVREANDSSTDKSNLESLIQDPLEVKIRRPCLKPDCKICDSTFTSAHKLDLHIREQHPHTHSFECEKCDSTFVTHHDLMVHNSACHMLHLFTCKQCLTIASLWYKIKQHVCVHLSKKLHCEVYGQEVSTKEALQAHTLCHMDKSWHTYKFCDRKFAAALSLMTHEVGKHGEGFPYGHCDKVFTSPAQKQRYCRVCISWNTTSMAPPGDAKSSLSHESK